MDSFGFFSKLRKQVSFHRSSSSSINRDEEEIFSSQQTEDREDDGFLLVGETQSERDTVFANSFTSFDRSDAPPTYRQVSEELPSYESVLSGKCQIVSGPPSIASPEMTRSFQSEPQSHISSHLSLHYLCDVPFQLHPSLAPCHDLWSTLHTLDLEARPFDWSRYSHDFTHERLYLRDFDSGQEAVMKNVCSQGNSGALSPSGKELDLIQF